MSDDDKNNSEDLEVTRDILSKLTFEEAKILRDRLGFKSSSEINSDEVSAQFEVVRERIKQIEEKALKKPALKNEFDALPKCSFCKLRSNQVNRLISAPDSDAYICDACINECLKMLN